MNRYLRFIYYQAGCTLDRDNPNLLVLFSLSTDKGLERTQEPVYPFIFIRHPSEMALHIMNLITIPDAKFWRNPRIHDRHLFLRRRNPGNRYYRKRVKRNSVERNYY